MPPSASSDPAAPASAPSWLAFAAGHARSIHKLIRPGDDRPDWASSPKSRSKSRRPVWE